MSTKPEVRSPARIAAEAIWDDMCDADSCGRYAERGGPRSREEEIQAASKIIEALYAPREQAIKELVEAAEEQTCSIRECGHADCDRLRSAIRKLKGEPS